jgi:hypothetical protein
MPRPAAKQLEGGKIMAEKRRQFISWLKKQAGRDDPIGDLARGMKMVQRPLERRSVSGLRSHMRLCGACLEALDALDDAAREWKA